jgi:hypothetical protein
MLRVEGGIFFFQGLYISELELLIRKWRATWHNLHQNKQIMSQSQLVKCPYCHHWPLEKTRGLASHIRQKPSCRRADEQVTWANIATKNQQAHLQSSSHLPTSDASHTLPGAYQCGSINTGLHDIYYSNSPPSTSTWNSPFLRPDNPEDELDEPGPRPRLNPTGPWLYLDRDEATKPAVGCYVGTKWDAMKANEKGRLPFYPWASQCKFDVVEWLLTEGLSQKAIDRFLNLQYVSLTFSFGNLSTLHNSNGTPSYRDNRSLIAHFHSPQQRRCMEELPDR